MWSTSRAGWRSSDHVFLLTLRPSTPPVPFSRFCADDAGRFRGQFAALPFPVFLAQGLRDRIFFRFFLARDDPIHAVFAGYDFSSSTLSFVTIHSRGFRFVLGPSVFVFPLPRPLFF